MNIRNKDKSHYKWCRLLDCLFIVAKGEDKKAEQRTKDMLYKIKHYWDEEK